MGDTIRDIKKKHYEQLSDNEKRFHESSKKVKAMHDHIVNECRKQGFTIGEISCLAGRLDLEAVNRRMRSWSEFF